MKNKIEYKNKLLEQRALLEALIKQNKKYFKNDQVSGFEFSKYLEKIQKAYDNFLFEQELTNAMITINIIITPITALKI